jgi:hypothetical protein
MERLPPPSAGWEKANRVCKRKKKYRSVSIVAQVDRIAETRGIKDDWRRSKGKQRSQQSRQTTRRNSEHQISAESAVKHVVMSP